MFSIAAYLVSSKIGVQKCHIIETYAPENRLYIVYRGSYISAHVLLNLLNELGKRDKMRGFASVNIRILWSISHHIQCLISQ